MKTERFDDEFRRKLLGLPADTDPGEVERVYLHMQTHRPAHPGVGWGKILLFGGMGLLLTASLIYNFIQSYRNTHLQVSLDSLAQKSRLTQNQITHDTVYVTRLSPKKITIDKPQSEAIKQSNGDESTEGQLTTSSKRDPELTEVASEPVHRINELADKATFPPTLANRRGKARAPADSANIVAKPVPEATTSVEGTVVRAHDERTQPWRITRQRHVARPTVTKPVTGVAKNNQFPLSRPHRPLRSETVASAEDIISTEPVTEFNRQPIEQLTSQPLSKATILNKSLVAYRVAVPPTTLTVTKQHRQRWHLSLPSLSVPNAQYRLGGGLTGGAEDQVGGTVFGEVALNPRWSFQTGVRVLHSQGFHYRNERDFEDHQDEDFHQLYTPQLPLMSDIEDINLSSVIAQVPIQLAYHYPLSKQWRLRLGIGTDLDLWVRSIVSYKYQGTGRSSERGMIAVEPSVHLFNNVTLTPSVEWYRKRWLFRAGPFISPQLRSVSYKPDDLSWGINLQVLYQLGK